MKALLLINTGSPDAPTIKAVRRYLHEFFSDPLLLDINPIARWCLRELIIVPLRSPRSAKLYQHIWTKEGSPLIVNSQKLRDKVQAQLGDHYKVVIGMGYGNPSIRSALEDLLKNNVSEIKALPLFPQYARPTVGSVEAGIKKLSQELRIQVPLEIIKPFYKNSGFIESHLQVGRDLWQKSKPDHTIFSFHGLPMKEINRDDTYKVQCYETAALLAQGLGLQKEDYTVCFQSRLKGSKWLAPFTDETVLDLIQKGKKRIACFSPSFVADCLETLEELGMRLKDFAIENGAEDFTLIPSLNSHPKWVETVVNLVR